MTELVIHWSEWIASRGRVKLGCADVTDIQLLLADGHSGVDSEGRAFAFEIARVTCADCKAVIRLGLEGR